jgi:hypothetical protein
LEPAFPNAFTFQKNFFFHIKEIKKLENFKADSRRVRLLFPRIDGHGGR